MGWRFRKRIKILPGIHVNLSKSGISTSVGGKGYTMNFGKRGFTETASIPGTGISYQRRHSAPNGNGSSATTQTPQAGPAPTGDGIWSLVGWALFIVFVLIVFSR